MRIWLCSLSIAGCSQRPLQAVGEIAGDGDMASSFDLRLGCSLPKTGTFCVEGRVRLLDGSELPAGERVRVALFEPLGFDNCIGCGEPQGEQETAGDFQFTDIKIPASHLVAILVRSADEGPKKDFFPTAIGVTVTSEQVFHVDAYAAPSAMLDAWTQSFGDFNCVPSQCVFARFFDAPAPAQNVRTHPAANPAAGVEIVTEGTVRSGIHYFNEGLALPDKTLTATGRSGAGIFSANANLFRLTGVAGTTAPAAWERHPVGVARSALWIDSLYR
jgi:hypothetical protein